MTLQRRGEHWYGTEAADIDAFLTQHYMLRPDFDVPHRVVHARCAACGGTVFWLNADEEDNALRICRNEGCPDEDGHVICGSGGSYDEDTEQECACPCGGEHFEIAVGFSHTLVA